MQQADSIHLHQKHDVAPTFRAVFFIVPGGNARDAHAMNLVHARLCNAYRIAQRGLKIVMVVVIVARSHGIDLYRCDGIPRLRRTWIHQDPHAGIARQKETGMSQPFQNHTIYPQLSIKSGFVPARPKA